MILGLLRTVLVLNRGMALPLSYAYVRVGDVDVNVYVVCLDGVNSSGVKNMSDVVEGVHEASVVPAFDGITGGGVIWFMSLSDALIFHGVGVNVSFAVIGDWNAYRRLIEEGSNAIVVNAHGMTVPVPAGYSREQWVDRIASAICDRNMTWVHVGWYPFYYTQQEGGVEELWGPDGFRALMANIGKSDVDCWPTLPETNRMWITGGAEYTILDAWPDLHNAYCVEHGRPLKASDFKNYTVMSLWGLEDDALTGAVIKFAPAFNVTSNFGFYVHIGTNQTFTGGQNGVPTQCDKWRSYAGAAAAMWTVAMRELAEERLPEAAQALGEAERDGRTKGLDAALSLLQRAESFFSGDNENCVNGYYRAVVFAIRAKKVAELAVHPTFMEKYGLQIGVLTVTTGMGAVAGGTFLVRRANSRKKEEKR
jgi:hypothetical protein